MVVPCAKISKLDLSHKKVRDKKIQALLNITRPSKSPLWERHPAPARSLLPLPWSGAEFSECFSFSVRAVLRKIYTQCKSKYTQSKLDLDWV